MFAVGFENGTWRVSLDGQLVRVTSDLKVAPGAAAEVLIEASGGC